MAPVLKAEAKPQPRKHSHFSPEALTQPVCPFCGVELPVMLPKRSDH